jgi:hypothetical protein
MGHQPPGLHYPDHRQPVFGLQVFDRVAAAKGDPGLGQFGLPAAQDRLQDTGGSDWMGKPTRLKASTERPPIA